jgi:hypothetical protein
MRTAMLVLLMAAAPAWAQAPNKLTPEEARAGTVLLFDGETTLGWEVSGDVKIKNGKLYSDSKGTLTWRGPQTAHIFVKGNSTQVTTSEAKNSRTYIFFGPGRSPIGPGQVPDVNVLMRPTGTKPLFNGKDLSGWKIFEGKYKNFLLQLECRTNGKHLNSGVFFRCREGEYQNGYEAQINNNFTASPPKEYVVDEFDPKTHKPIEKKKVKSSAVDFGTGSIYRRIPATKDIAKDGEWFTMTILAHGNHFATWVNGIQTIDWYDRRPMNDNARNGYRKEAGHISLQGHDPTTNLSFRNIRIAELPD